MVGGAAGVRSLLPSETATQHNAATTILLTAGKESN